MNTEPLFPIKVDPDRLQELNEQFSLAFERFRPIIEPFELEEPNFMDEIKDALNTMILGLLRSRKVMLAVLAVINTLVAHYTNIPTEVWASIDALLLAVIGGIAYEDAAEKRGS